jgi:dihydroorotase
MSMLANPNPMQVPANTQITIPLPADFHHHFRQGPLVADTVAHASSRFGACLAMPNLSPPVTTVERCLEYKAELESALTSSSLPGFKFINVLYLTDNTTAETVRAMHANGIAGFKYYPAGATTNSAAGVTDVANVYPLFEVMQELGMILCVHSEVARFDVDVFDREKVFIDEILRPLVAAYPKLKIVMEHVSTSYAVDFILKEAPPSVFGSITPHHLLHNRNAILSQGLRPHFFCLPVLKRESHRVALLGAATGNTGRFIMGTDSAPHDTANKLTSCGCAGVFVGHAAVEFYVEAFESVGKLDALASFIQTGKDLYGLDDGKIMTLEKKSWKVPDVYKFGAGNVTPLRNGEDVTWSIVKVE